MPELYTDLAWMGLEGTDIYNTTTSLTSADRERIKDDRLWAEAKCLPTNTVQPSTTPCD